MKRPFAKLRFPSALVVVTLLSGCAGDKPAGDTTAYAKKSAAMAMPGYETASEIRAMTPRKATIAEQHPCYSTFKTADGKRFSIGSPAATPEVVGFLSTLNTGRTYDFPSAFLDYQKTKPQ